MRCSGIGGLDACTSWESFGFRFVYLMILLLNVVECYRILQLEEVYNNHLSCTGNVKI